MIDNTFGLTTGSSDGGIRTHDVDDTLLLFLAEVWPDRETEHTLSHPSRNGKIIRAERQPSIRYLQVRRDRIMNQRLHVRIAERALQGVAALALHNVQVPGRIRGGGDHR